jgi:hypothetical protein
MYRRSGSGSIMLALEEETENARRNGRQTRMGGNGEVKGWSTWINVGRRRVSSSPTGV